MVPVIRFGLVAAFAGATAIVTGCGGGGSSSPTYSISGSVSDLSTGIAVTGAMISLSGARSMSTTTDSSGNFSLAALPEGTYTLTPSMAPFTFAPTSLSVTLSGGDHGGVNFVRQSYSISGRVTQALTGSAQAQVAVSVSGTLSGSATTDVNGQYSIASLANGNYSVSASVNGEGVAPQLIVVTLNGANVSGQNFFTAKQTAIASGITFLPSTNVSPAPIPHASLAVGNGNTYFSDSSSTPIKKVALASPAVTALATRMSVSPDGAAIYGQWIYWRAGDSLYQSLQDGSATTVLTSGLRDPTVDGFATDLAVDADSVYFVDLATGTCSGVCPWMIERIPRGGGSPVVMASTTRRVVALASDAASIYWEEYSLEPVSTGCQCGSSINRVAKSGGTPTQLVDGMLNAPPPNPGPGFQVGSWVPTGGITVDASQLYFTVSAYYGLPGYQVSSVSVAGGAVAPLATVPSSAQNAINTIRTLTLYLGNLYWIDMASGALYAMPATGGAPASIAKVALTDLSHPSALVIAAGQAFWTEPGTYTGCCLTAGAGAIRSVPLAGGSISLVQGGLDAPGWLTTDGTNLAWTEAWRVGVAPAAGGAAHTAAAGISTNMPAILADANFAYALDGDFIKKVPVGGGALERTASARINIGDSSVHDDDLASDGTNFYWTVTDMFSNSAVYTARVSGGPTTLLGLPQGALGSTITQCFGRVAVDTQYVYWISASRTTSGGCSLERVPLTGGTATILADGADLRDFTIDGTHIYVAGANSGIQVLPIGGGSATLFANIGGEVVIADATNVYWLSGTSLWLQSKSGSAASPTPVPAGVPVDPTKSAEALVGDRNGLYLSSTLTGNIYLVQ